MELTQQPTISMLIMLLFFFFMYFLYRHFLVLNEKKCKEKKKQNFLFHSLRRFYDQRTTNYDAIFLDATISTCKPIRTTTQKNDQTSAMRIYQLRLFCCDLSGNVVYSDLLPCIIHHFRFLVRVTLNDTCLISYGDTYMSQPIQDSVLLWFTVRTLLPNKRAQ